MRHASIYEGLDTPEASRSGPFRGPGVETFGALAPPAVTARPDDADFCEVLKLEAARVRATGAIGSFHEHGQSGRALLLGRSAIPAPSAALDDLMDAARHCRTARRSDDRRPVEPLLQIRGRAESPHIVSLIGAVGPQGYVVVTYLFADEQLAGRTSIDAWGAVSAASAAYFRLWLKSRIHERDLSGMGAALDATSPAVFVLDRNKRILFSNGAARILVLREDGLRRTGELLAATALDDALHLQVTLDHVANAEGQSLASGGPSSFQLRRRGAQRPLIATASAVPLAPAGDTDPAIILQVIDPDTDIEPLLGPACRFYRLSPVEARLTALIATGIALTDAARTLRIKEPTARSYLKQVFIKTDTRRQADLVRVMLSSVVHMAPNCAAALC